MARYTDGAARKQELQAMASTEGDGRAGFRERVLLPRRSLIDLLEEFTECDMPFEVYLDRLPPLHPRYYSISSSARVSPDICSITVGVLEVPRGQETDCSPESAPATWTGIRLRAPSSLSCASPASRSGLRTTRTFP